MAPQKDPILGDIARATGLSRETVEQVMYRFSDLALERLRAGHAGRARAG